MSETIIPMLPEQIESTLSSVLYLFLIEKNSKKFFY